MTNSPSLPEAERRMLGTSEIVAFSEGGVAEIARELDEALAPGIQVLRPLGAGAMGLVFVGRDPLLKRLVAIKVLAPHLADDVVARERFVRESEARAAVSHPNVAGIYVVGELPRSGTPYYVMQYIEGRTLADELADGAVMSESRVKRIIGETASALHAAHSRGVVHRDVKPANIMLESETGRPVVLDFGISAVLQRSGAPENARLTTAGSYVGTPTYMSPEQASGEPVSGKSDVYGLGLIAFELLTGKPVFDGPPIVVMAAHVEKPPPDLHELRPGIDGHLAEVVERCLRKNADERPSAEDIAHSLLPGARMLIEWPPPGLELLRGLGIRLMWRWLSVCIAALSFFVVLYARPSTSSPNWRGGEQSVLWQGIAAPRGASSVGAHLSIRDTESATAIWMFLAGSAMAFLVFMVFMAIMRTARLAHSVRAARTLGYPWRVLVDVSVDDHPDTASLLNGAGVYALWAPERRDALRRVRKQRAVAAAVAIAFGLLAPVAWITGALRVGSASSTELVTGPELLLVVLPFLMALAAIGTLDRRGRSATMRQRAEGSRIHVDLVRAWLIGIGISPAGIERHSNRVVAALASGFCALALLTVTYLVLVVLVTVFTSTFHLVNSRVRNDQWESTLATDSAGVMRFSELDSIARSAAIAPATATPDVEAARLVISRAFVAPNAPAAPAALELALDSARLIAPSAPEGKIAWNVGDVLGRNSLPGPAMLDSARRAAASPWLPIWRRFAASADYAPMWMYREGMPGVKYPMEIPVMRSGDIKDLAYRNSLAGLVALSQGDIRTALLRGRENIAAGRKIMRGPTYLDNLVGVVVIGIGRGELSIVARTTGNKALEAEVEAIRQAQMRWSRQRLPSSLLSSLTADPTSRDVIRYARTVEAPAYYTELMMMSLAGICSNSREVLFGLDPSRLALVRDIAVASRNPRNAEFVRLSEQWSKDFAAGLIDVGELVGGDGTMPVVFKPLGWLGMNGFQQRAWLCSVGL